MDIDRRALPCDPKAVLSVSCPASAAHLRPLLPHPVVPQLVTEHIVAVFFLLSFRARVDVEIDASYLKVERATAIAPEVATRTTRQPRAVIDDDTSTWSSSTWSSSTWSSSTWSSSTWSSSTTDTDTDTETDTDTTWTDDTDTSTESTDSDDVVPADADEDQFMASDAYKNATQMRPRRLHNSAYPYVVLPVRFDWRLGRPRRPQRVGLTFYNVNSAETAALCVRTALVFDAESLSLKGTTSSLGESMSARRGRIRNQLAWGGKNRFHKAPACFDISELPNLRKLPTGSGTMRWPQFKSLRLPANVGRCAVDLKGQHELREIVFHDATPMTSFAAAVKMQAVTQIRALDLRVCKRLQTFGDRAFQACPMLVRFCARGLPQLESIGPYAFARCRHLQVVDLRDCPNLFKDEPPVSSTFGDCRELQLVMCDPHCRSSIMARSTRADVVRCDTVDASAVGRDFQCCCGTLRVQ